MTLFIQILVTSLIVLIFFALFNWIIYKASRNGKGFGCTAIGDEEGLCSSCPGRGIRCTIKRKLRIKNVEKENT